MFGHLRTYVETVEPLNKYVIKPFHADVFMHTWECLERSTESHQVADKLLKDKVFDANELYKLYPRLTLSVEPELKIDNEMDYYSEKSLAGLKSLHYSMAKAVALAIDSEVNYDAVLLIRPDVLIKERIDLNRAKSYVNDYPYPNYLYAGYFIEEGYDDTSFLDKWGASDCFMFTNLNVLEVLLELNDCSEIYKQPYTSWGESQFRYFMQLKGVFGRPWNVIAPRDWAIKRSGGEHSKISIDILMYTRKGMKSILDLMKTIKRRF
jgi:hypothetical protein